MDKKQLQALANELAKNLRSLTEASAKDAMAFFSKHCAKYIHASSV